MHQLIKHSHFLYLDIRYCVKYSYPHCCHFRMAEPPSSTLQTFPKFTELNDLVNEKVKYIKKKIVAV